MNRPPRADDDLPTGEREDLTEEQLSALLGGWQLTRRDLLKLAAGAAAAGALQVSAGPGAALARRDRVLGGPHEAVLPQSAGAFSATVLRPKDLLSLRFEFLNLQLKTDQPLGARLERIDAAAPAYIVVHFPPQNIAERAFTEAETPGVACPDPNTGDETGCLVVPVDARIAGASRLAFKVPSGVSYIPYSLEHEQGLLAWERLEPSVVPVALPRPALSAPLLAIEPGQASGLAAGAPSAGAKGIAPRAFFDVILDPQLAIKPVLRAPLGNETAIEAPWQLFISPSNLGGWAHEPGPVTRGGRTELWHTRLGVRKTTPAPRVDEEDTFQRTVRAVWMPGFDKSVVPSSSPVPFRMSLNRNDRYQIVRLSADFSENYTPQPVQVNRLMLTALGAWMDTRGAWNLLAINQKIEPDLSLAEWRHMATMGRDHYVRVVKFGYLFPFGHPAALIEVTERKFHVVKTGSQSGYRGAFLRKRTFIVVRQPEMTYPAHTSQPHGGRKMPFKSARITTLVTPNLDAFDGPNKVPETDVPVAGDSQAFWPRVGGADFLFHIVARDGDGQRSEFSAPLIFVSAEIATNKTPMEALVGYYRDTLAADNARRHRSMSGQKVAFAESSKGSSGDTTFEVATLTFGAALPAPDNASLPVDQPRFYPTVEAAQVRLSAVEQVAGPPVQAQGSAAAPVTIQLHDTYLNDGFKGANKGAVFAKIAGQQKPALNFPADRSGGIVTPNMSIDGLSRTLGPVGGNVDTLLTEGFKPETFFSDAKILGGIALKDIIGPFKPAELAAAAAADRIPRLASRTIYPGGDTSQVPEAVETKLVWKPTLVKDPLHIFVPESNASLLVTATFVTKLSGPQDSTYEVVGTLQNFKMNLVGDQAPLHVLTIAFSKLTFTSAKGQKPAVDVAIKDLKFSGLLSLVNEFQPFLKSGSGFGAVDLLPPPDPGIRAGYTLSIPTIAVGVFTLQNISLSASLTIPFTGKPARVRFAFADRSNPFLLTVSMFGGGGFFAVELGLDGFESLEAALEFGGDISLDIGVASGGVYVMAGVYFKLEQTADGKDKTTFEGYLRLGGAVEVLGLITISAEFYMSLSYESESDEIWGQATLTIEIEVAFYSDSVELSVERRFPASSHRISFVDLMPPRDPAHLTQGSAAWDAYVAAFAPVPA